MSLDSKGTFWHIQVELWPYTIIILSVDHLLGTSCLFLGARRDHGIALALLGCQGGWIATVSV